MVHVDWDKLMEGDTWINGATQATNTQHQSSILKICRMRLRQALSGGRIALCSKETVAQDEVYGVGVN
jgi:hypothetical protein